MMEAELTGVALKAAELMEVGLKEGPLTEVYLLGIRQPERG